MADSTPAPAAPSMAGVAQNTNDQQGQILGAIAKYGQAGADAYNQAQNAVQGYRQQILDGIAKAQGIGGDASALLQSQVQASMAPHLADLQAGQANLAGDVARSNQMYTNYANEAQAAVPVIQANSQKLMTIRDAALQQAQQQIDAQAAAKAAQDAQDLKLAQLQVAQQQAQTQAAQANAAKAAATATAKAPTSSDLFGAAKALADQGPVSLSQTAAEVGTKTPLTNDMLMTAQDEAAYAQNGDTRYSPDPAVNLAKEFGQAYGLPDSQINSIVTPQAIKAYESAANPAPVTPDDVKAATTALKGDAGGANAVLNGSRWPAVQQAVNAIATAPRDASGLISDGSAYNGLTPWDAFSKWITSPAAQLAPGDTKTPQVATAFYKSFLSALK